MKKIEAIVRKEKFQDVYATLEKSGIGGMTIAEARGFGHHHKNRRARGPAPFSVVDAQRRHNSKLLRIQFTIK